MTEPMCGLCPAGAYADPTCPHQAQPPARAGTILRQAWITRADLRANPDRLYVFGDNMERRGLGGQAAEMRGEPNAVGVVTKWRPGCGAYDYLADQDLVSADVRPRWDEAFDRLRAHLAAGGTVVLPTEPLGSGLADLPRRAPAVAAELARRVAGLGVGGGV